MKSARILHNPGAGAKAYSRKKLIGELEGKGLSCSYNSTKKPGWDVLNDKDDLLIVAGGDGTVRKVADLLLHGKRLDKKAPVAVLPLGTANNISKTLHGLKDAEAVLAAWKAQTTMQMDVGSVGGLRETDFFLEGLGVGVFPDLMRAMKKQARKQEQHPEKEIKTALELLYDLVMGYKPKYCKLKIDGRDHSGKYLMVEVMNIRSVGPNLTLAPDANPGDGFFDIVLIPARDQNKLAIYIMHKIQGIEEPFNFEIVRGKDVVLRWSGSYCHVDDQLLRTDKLMQLNIGLRPGLLDFMTTGLENEAPVTA